MAKFFASIIMIIAVVCFDAAIASRYLRPTADQASAPCTMHSQSSSSDSAGSLNESGTISIGNKVFNIVDEGDVMTIGDTKFRVFS
ncbi:hypothetical protein PC118_g2431 [Phytophthora cactorum]|uniref:Pectate lyase n=1 Tax=Phytophthora cactorum TaxID=29920 RepID=A0A329SQS2_9STRA|nr:hypothetical protein GQ600_5284 [Phytophthora cactorum]KAG2996591.1 hypothetical protein PC118_g2431 [Phytophthora cactorum]KAG3188943.1 hypothetical protein C6341_g2516 [Phytophthora cactorum]RAW37942.1 hypothetical protein PC110_g5822 [Phytophthora cactorum]